MENTDQLNQTPENDNSREENSTSVKDTEKNANETLYETDTAKSVQAEKKEEAVGSSQSPEKKKEEKPVEEEKEEKKEKAVAVAVAEKKEAEKKEAEKKEEEKKEEAVGSSQSPEKKKEEKPVEEEKEEKKEKAVAVAVAEKREEEKKEEAVGSSQSTEKKPAEVKDEKPVDKREEPKEEIEETEENYLKFSKEDLVELMENAVKEEDVNSIKTKVALIKVRFLYLTKAEKEERLSKFLAEGGTKEDYVPSEDLLEDRFKAAFDIYKKNKAVFLVKQEELKQENLKIKNQILDDLKELIGSEETLKKTYDDFKELQEKWKTIGMVPKGEINNLWQNYHFLVEKFFDKVKINKELKDLDLKKNLELKVQLCEKAEELLFETSIQKSFKDLQKLHEQWKEIGPVMMEVKDEIWERFKRTTDKINEGRREYYNKIQENQQSNYIAKVALCDKAEGILTSEFTTIKQWQDKTIEINELFKIWKFIGTAPKKENDDIWARFKTFIDTFYSNKKDYFSKIKDQQLNNYNLKLDLCVQAEALKYNTDWKKTSNDLIKLQQDWKNIGPVPRKHSDKIWKRFRSACDEFFNAKAEYFSNIQEHESTNLKLKMELIEKISNHEFSEEKNENLEKLKEFQREWMEIGHVPIREKDKIQKEFKVVIDKLLNKLKISTVEISALNYKTRLESMMNSPESSRIISKESGFIRNKISKLKEDITLWENNMGFFANTKKANLLKEEFDKKVQKSKQEVLLLEAKLKYLREAR